MILLKRLWHVLTAFLYLRLYELLCGALVLSVVFYFSNSMGGASDWERAPRPIYALVSALGFIGLYYILFKYLLVALLTTLVLGITPLFRRVPLAAVNSLTYVVHSLWIIHGMPNGLPLPIWAVWAIIVVFDGLSPALLPNRLFSPGTSQN